MRSPRHDYVACLLENIAAKVESGYHPDCILLWTWTAPYANIVVNTVLDKSCVFAISSMTTYAVRLMYAGGKAAAVCMQHSTLTIMPLRHRCRRRRPAPPGGAWWTRICRLRQTLTPPAQHLWKGPTPLRPSHPFYCQPIRRSDGEMRGRAELHRRLPC